MESGTVLLSDNVSKALSSRSGIFMNECTDQAHPVNYAAVAQIIKVDGLLYHASQLARVLEQELKEQVLPLPQVGNVRGAVLFWGVEFVRDKQTRQPFEDKGLPRLFMVWGWNWVCKYTYLKAWLVAPSEIPSFSSRCIIA